MTRPTRRPSVLSWLLILVVVPRRGEAWGLSSPSSPTRTATGGCVESSSSSSSSPGGRLCRDDNDEVDEADAEDGSRRRGTPLAPWSRRAWVSAALGGVVASSFAGDAAAAAAASPGLSQRGEDARTRLLRLIGTDVDGGGGGKEAPVASDAAVLEAIDVLLPYDPARGEGATLAADLDGEWRLLWSVGADAFSPLLTLPKPFRPESFQYLGDAAASEVGPGRVAQGLTGGALLGPTQLWLSSGVRPSPDNPSVLTILPPFRFEIGGRYGSGRPKRRIVAEAESDADFRKLNARTSEAQAAPSNSYKQLYLERSGKGSLRISTITEGDPVIVGAVFVHEKMG